VLQLEHPVKPLRWVLRKDHEKVQLRIVDETGIEGREPDIISFSMKQPANPETLSPSEVRSGVPVSPPGALFIGIHGTYHDEVVVSTGLTARGIQGLGITPAYAEVANGSASIENSLLTLQYWNSARLAGFMSEYRREKVVSGLAAAVYEAICGHAWIRLETAFRNKPALRSTLEALQRGVHNRGGFAAVLLRDFGTVDHDAGRAAHWYKMLADRYGLHANTAVFSLALCLARQPHDVHRKFDKGLYTLLEEISRQPAILRGARFLALLHQNRASLLTAQAGGKA
jgi:hypothetical protein